MSLVMMRMLPKSRVKVSRLWDISVPTGGRLTPVEAWLPRSSYCLIEIRIEVLVAKVRRGKDHFVIKAFELVLMNAHGAKSEGLTLMMIEGKIEICDWIPTSLSIKGLVPAVERIIIKAVQVPS